MEILFGEFHVNDRKSLETLLTIGSAGFFLHNSVSPFSKVGVTVLVR